ncbi:hypothetical protein ACSQ67_006383 [Phaseolus vulgaris]
MVTEASLDAHKTSPEMTGSTTAHPPVQGPENTQETDARKQDSNKSKVKNESNKTVPFYKLFSFADYWDCLLMLVGALSAVANGIVMPLMTILIGDAIDAFGGNADNKQTVVHEVSKASLKFASIGAGAFFAAFFQVSCWVITGERQAARIRGLYLKAILRQDISFFDQETNSGEVVGRMSGRKIHPGCGMFFGGIVVAFIKGWLLSLVLLSSLPLLVLSGSIMSFAFAKMASRGQAAYSEAATLVERTIGSIRTVASFTGEKQAIAQYNLYLTKAYRVGVQEGLTGGFGFGFVRLFIYCTYGLTIWFGGKMVIEKGYTGGQVISVFFAVLTGSMSLGQTSPSLAAFAAGQAAAFKMFETIKRQPDIDAYDSSGKQLDDISGDIELREVCFSYPSRPDEQIFNRFSISISSGTTAALVGQSGSGKSTVISLIERFYDPQAGEVLIDGINVREFQLKWIRQKIGLVSQEPALFTCSIKENIGYGKEWATDEEIRAAAELANASNFIDKFPHGFDTMVGEHGTQLSGGQKQRISIARAILKDPRILLLDEATSALDAESERVVQETLDRIMINRTTVIVAHRLSTIRNADVIAVIHEGKVVEKGTHAELTKDPDGAFSQLVRLQEIKRESEQHDENYLSGAENMVDSERQPSQRYSFPQSLSRGSSGRGNSGQHSFRISNAMPTTQDLFETSEGGSGAFPSAASHKPQEVSFLRIAYLNKPEIPLLLVGTLAAAVTGAILPTVGLLLSHMINTFYEPADELRKDSKFWALIFVALSVGWFDKAENSSGALGARLSTDAASIRTLVGDALGLLVQDIATVVTALAIAFDTNWQLSLIVLVLVPLVVLNGHLQMKSMQGFSTDAKKLYEEASQVANDAVGNIRTVAAFCAEEKVMKLYQKKCAGPIQTGIRQGLVSGTGFGLSLFFLFSVYACSFYAGARLVEKGKTSISDVFRVFFALSMAAIAMSQSAFMTPAANKAKSSAASVFAILDQKSRIDTSDESGMTLQQVKGDIEFHHVTFKYPTRPHVPVLRDLSLTIHAGKTVALVGESGSGKSTVISLLQRFYDPDLGQITLDGTEIQKLKLKWFRQQMGLVSQEPALFNDTIRANIAYGKGGDATEAEIIAAAELANAHKFISSLQQGYDTLVGERGIQLSGGQKQRVAIARAIVKSPKILLLDEATSALDAESERVVQDALDRVRVDRTTIVVAHRLSTIKDADLIAVVKNGVIAEKGKHDTLLNKGGAYHSLVALHSSAASS